MQEWILAFTLGNAAILTNACLLPLYPGLIAFLAGSNPSESSQAWKPVVLGGLVLAGIMTMMTLIGLLLALLSSSFGSVLPWMLPPIYALVIILGIAMLRGANPFARLQMAQAPLLRNRWLTAYTYGLLFGPMTLPCTGPIILSAFTVGGGAGDILDGLLYFFFFGLGFGWPLLVLPLFALPLQRRAVRWLGQNHDALTRASGLLLVAVGVFGILTEMVPQIDMNFEFSQAAQLLYWVISFGLTVGLAYLWIRRSAATLREAQA